jgi:hypothetical protein
MKQYLVTIMEYRVGTEDYLTEALDVQSAIGSVVIEHNITLTDDSHITVRTVALEEKISGIKKSWQGTKAPEDDDWASKRYRV